MSSRTIDIAAVAILALTASLRPNLAVAVGIVLANTVSTATMVDALQKFSMSIIDFLFFANKYLWFVAFMVFVFETTLKAASIEKRTRRGRNGTSRDIGRSGHDLKDAFHLFFPCIAYSYVTVNQSPRQHRIGLSSSSFDKRHV